MEQLLSASQLNVQQKLEKFSTRRDPLVILKSVNKCGEGKDPTDPKFPMVGTNLG